MLFPICTFWGKTNKIELLLGLLCISTRWKHTRKIHAFSISVLGSKSTVICLKQWLGAEETDHGANNIFINPLSIQLIIKMFLRMLSPSNLNYFKASVTSAFDRT